MANILQSVTDVLKRSLDGQPPPPAILGTIGNRLDELLAVSVDPTGDGIDRWLGSLRAITNDTRLHETLLVRAVQMNFPRLAESLTLLGAVVAGLTMRYSSGAVEGTVNPTKQLMAAMYGRAKFDLLRKLILLA